MYWPLLSALVFEIEFRSELSTHGLLGKLWGSTPTSLALVLQVCVTLPLLDQNSGLHTLVAVPLGTEPSHQPFWTALKWQNLGGIGLDFVEIFSVVSEGANPQ